MIKNTSAWPLMKPFKKCTLLAVLKSIQCIHSHVHPHTRHVAVSYLIRKHTILISTYFQVTKRANDVLFMWSHDLHINIIMLMTSTSSIHFKDFWLFFFLNLTFQRWNLLHTNNKKSSGFAKCWDSYFTCFTLYIYIMMRFCPFSNPSQCLPL